MVEVEIGICIFLMHHIKVTLQYYSFAVFHTWCGWFSDDYISDFVFKSFQPEIVPEIFHEFNHAIFFF